MKFIIRKGAIGISNIIVGTLELLFSLEETKTVYGSIYYKLKDYKIVKHGTNDFLESLKFYIEKKIKDDKCYFKINDEYFSGVDISWTSNNFIDFESDEEAKVYFKLK